MTLIDSVKLPTWAICFIHYGDGSALSDDDISMVSEWLDTMPDFATFDHIDDEPYFAPYPEFGLACDVVDVNVYA